MTERLIYENDFTHDTGEFVLEGKGRYVIADGRLVLDDSVTGSGLTLWLKREFNCPVRIVYEAEVLEPELANNLNLFFMARTTEDAPVTSLKLDGAYPEYHKRCRMYIFTMTGDMAGDSKLTGWSRLRKDPGFVLLSEDSTVKTELHVPYQLEFTVRSGQIVCGIDGRTVHRVMDEAPYVTGSIGFRTWKTRLCIRRLSVFALGVES